ncbi:MAG: DNA mismatch repair protein MutS [Deltaproteobacteria bacterium]|nr:DNA mismatch repair protein MutS [Deltaproteobacteria bacterium]
MSGTGSDAKRTTAPGPHAEYSDAIRSGRDELQDWHARERWLSHARLAVFAAGLVLGWLAFGSRTLAAVWVGPPVLVFAALLIVHDRAIRKHRRAERIVDFYERGLARIEDTWMGHGNTGAAHAPDGHPYADDLDLFGPGSLFELLCTARTTAGESMLARWLLEPVDADVARGRQRAVRELTPRTALRRDLSLLGEDIGGRIAADSLSSWGSAPIRLHPGLQIVAAGMTGLTGLGIALWITTDIGAIPFLFFLAAQGGFAAWLRPRVRAVLAGVEAPSHELAVLSGLLARLEEESVSSERLVELRAELETGGVPPSRRIASLRRLVDLLDARRNQFFAPIGALLLWSTQLAVALERWRSECGDALGPWIEAAAEIEVLCAFGGYAYEHPDCVHAEFLDAGPLFDAEGLGHPLIPDARCVRNDVSLGGGCQAWMMSGSNMSGKSTLLRTVGVATLLAMAGAPVRASRLRLSSMQLGASIRISDSLQQGASTFFAEITRLRQIVELTAADRPLLFLLDEVLHGTNSHDRRIGAEAVVSGLVARGAIGLVTTHDLALARIADELAPRLQNVHFQDHIEDGEMSFDYKLRPGVVTRSNALELMRSVGLDV